MTDPLNVAQPYDNAPKKSKSYGAYTSAIIAGIALVAAYRPDWRWLQVLNARAPELTVVLPVVLGPIGIIGATLSKPPHWLCKVWSRVWGWINGRARNLTPPGSAP